MFVKGDDIAKGAITPYHLKINSKSLPTKNPIGPSAIGNPDFFEEKVLARGSLVQESWFGAYPSLADSAIYGNLGKWAIAVDTGVNKSCALTEYGAKFKRIGSNGTTYYGIASLLTAGKSYRLSEKNLAFRFGFRYDPTDNEGDNGWCGKHTSGDAIAETEVAYFAAGLMFNAPKLATGSTTIGANTLKFTSRILGYGYVVTLLGTGNDKTLEITTETSTAVTVQLATNGGGVITTTAAQLNELAFEYIVPQCSGSGAISTGAELTLVAVGANGAYMEATPGGTWHLKCYSAQATMYDYDTHIDVEQEGVVDFLVEYESDGRRIFIDIHWALDGVYQDTVECSLLTSSLFATPLSVGFAAYYIDPDSVATDDVAYEATITDVAIYRTPAVED